jgi:hypothetical protein
VERKSPGHVQVTIPYSIYSRVVEFVTAIQSSAKPEEYIVPILKATPGEGCIEY